MATTEPKHPKKPSEHAAHTTHRGVPQGLDTTESGPARLYAPGKPHQMEAGPCRLSNVPVVAHSRHPTGSPTSARQHGADTTESGPPRLGRQRT
jgi:hypothetical protein